MSARSRGWCGSVRWCGVWCFGVGDDPRSNRRRVGGGANDVRLTVDPAPRTDPRPRRVGGSSCPVVPERVFAGRTRVRMYGQSNICSVIEQVFGEGGGHYLQLCHARYGVSLVGKFATAFRCRRVR